MIKVLHSADWHLDSPLQGRSPAQTQRLRDALLRLPRMVVEAARAEGCHMILLSGDLFDGPCSAESLQAVSRALAEAEMPVFISPGNHDPFRPGSPWQQTDWPENVHIFSGEQVQSVAIPALDCRVYGRAFTGAYADSVQRLRAAGEEAIHIGLLHADPTQPDSPYCPITTRQIQDSGMTYLALGHIHKGGQLRAGDTLCAWPGSPMGRGFDEPGKRGVLVVTIDENCSAQPLFLDTPRFYEFTCEVDGDAAAAIAGVLPAAGSEDFYRVTLTGESTPPDLAALQQEFSQFPNLQLRDDTVPPVDLWAGAGEDTLEGIYFRLLQQALEGQDAHNRRQILLAAKLSRQLLEGGEVKLP